MSSVLEILPPERLRPDHDVSRFANGKHPVLDIWLKERALASEGLSARTYVICRATEPLIVVGYYALSTAIEERRALPSAKLRRGMPHQVPLLLIGRLALDASVQGMGLGADLLSDAIRRCCAAADIAGARAVIAHAIDDIAADFYERHGFVRSALGERAMLLPIEVARTALTG
ncbi:MAG: GNAT family N-acetyltransferase [Pseudomonadota bacterium]|nr:GNAT family N-acetyltransferase [Pseudomonadota bacterium]